MQPINSSADNAVRLAHFSDIHVTCRPLGWQREDWLTKRLPAWMNLRILGRAFRFRHAEEVLAALMADLRQRRPVEVSAAGAGHPPGGEQHGRQAEGQHGTAQHGHGATAEA